MLSRTAKTVMNRALLNGGERNGGYATFVWQERAQTLATQMTPIPSLKPLCLLYQNQVGGVLRGNTIRGNRPERF